MEKHAINYSWLLKGITDIKVTFLESNFFKKANGVRPIFLFIFIEQIFIYIYFPIFTYTSYI